MILNFNLLVFFYVNYGACGFLSFLLKTYLYKFGIKYVNDIYFIFVKKRTLLNLNGMSARGTRTGT